MSADSQNTPRQFSGQTLIIASHNAGKVREIATLLAAWVPEVRSAKEIGLDEPEETGDTFIANARLKALAAAKAGGQPALADDSGLAVAALGGAPGIYSARWGGAERDFAAAMARVEQALSGQTDRRASFVCALALAWPDGHVECVEGTVQGALIWPPRGSQGFGYDPMFVPEGFRQTFAEMPPEAKHAISHRADAFARLVQRCFAAPE